MYLLDIIPLTKILHPQSQILSYFCGQNLPAGAIVQIPLGRRQETGVVLDTHEIADFKMAIKSADYELRNIKKIISVEPILTPKQIKLALFLGQYYFASPGIFAKMSLPPYSSSKTVGRVDKSTKKVLDSSLSRAQSRDSNDKIKQKLIVAPTVSQAENIAAKNKNTVLWHSGLKQKQRDEIWRNVKNGVVETVIGTRSAVFLPFTNLKEIIVEDESNPNHKSWDMFPHWRVHEAAQKLAEIFDAKLILKNSFLSELKTSAQGGSASGGKNYQLPAIIDLRQELKEGNFYMLSRALQVAIKEALARKKQILLFINRRGTANFVLCRDCGHTILCPNCDAPLAYHLVNGQPMMLCHRCGTKEKTPSLCPKCHGSRVKTVGAGTQKAEFEAKKLFSQAQVARLDSDTAPNPKDQQKIIQAFVKKEIDILITTQIIFSWLEETKKAAPAVVAMLFADTLLNLPDFRSGERTLQTIMTLASVVARSKATKQSRDITTVHEIATLPSVARNDGILIIQTYNPENSTLQATAKNDYQSFWQEEMEARRALNYPPFSQIVKLTFRHRDGKIAGQEAKILVAKLRRINKDDKIEISDALPAFIPKEKGKYVWNIIIKFLPSVIASGAKRNEAIPNEYNASEFLLRRNSLLKYVPPNWEIDVDPENLL